MKLSGATYPATAPITLPRTVFLQIERPKYRDTINVRGKAKINTKGVLTIVAANKKMIPNMTNARASEMLGHPQPGVSAMKAMTKVRGKAMIEPKIDARPQTAKTLA